MNKNLPSRELYDGDLYEKNIMDGTTGTNTGNAVIDNNAVLVCFGGSLTAGRNATVLGQDDKSQSYPAFLQDKLKIQVVNAGVSGDTTATGLARIQNDVISKNPAIVIIELGANDFFNGIDLIEDIWSGVWGTNKMSQDGIHPTAAGYQTMADNYFKTISSYLQEKGMVQ